MSTSLHAARLSDNSDWWARTSEQLAQFATERGTPASLGIITFDYDGPVVNEGEEGGDDVFDAAEYALEQKFGERDDWA